MVPARPAHMKVIAADARRDWKKLVGHGFLVVGSLVLCCCTARIFEAPQLQRYMKTGKVSGASDGTSVTGQ
jgi:hypothetical protein